MSKETRIREYTSMFGRKEHILVNKDNVEFIGKNLVTITTNEKASKGSGTTGGGGGVADIQLIAIEKNVYEERDSYKQVIKKIKVYKR